MRLILSVLVPLINASTLRTLAGKLRRGEVLVHNQHTGQVLPRRRWRPGIARRIARDALRLQAKRFQRFTVRRLFGGSRRESRYHFDRAVGRRTVALRRERPTLREQLTKLSRRPWVNRKRIREIEADLAVRPRLAALAAEVTRLAPNRRRLRVA